MAVRPFAFGVRYRDRGRTLAVRSTARGSQRYVVEVERRGQKTRRREHGSLASALRDFAQSWRERLH
jgi:hypothetical protein